MSCADSLPESIVMTVADFLFAVIDEDICGLHLNALFVACQLCLQSMPLITSLGAVPILAGVLPLAPDLRSECDQTISARSLSIVFL
jgi:hypothetical protein